MSLKILIVLISCSLVDQFTSAHNESSYFHDENVHDKGKIRERMKDYYKEEDIDKQLDLDSEESMDFHYFNINDYNKDHQLDGLELYRGIDQFREEGGISDEAHTEELVNSILERVDKNKDGYINFFEFNQAHKEGHE